MDLLLAPRVFAAVRAEDLVLLDAAAGDYLLLPGAGPLAAPAPDSNRLGCTAPELAETLAGLGVLHPDGVLAPRRPIPAPPNRDLGCEVGPRPGLAEAARWAYTAAQMTQSYGRRPFGALVSAELAAPPGKAVPAEAAAHARVFRRLLPWVPFQGQCLFRSLMLRAYLRRTGLAATWVVGCQTWPFEAHCWLQAGDLVLDDTADHVAGFTPLMAV